MPNNAYESLTISDTAVPLTSTVYAATGQAHARHATIAVEDEPLRFRIDGTAPTSSEGIPVDDGDVIELNSLSEIKNFQAIRQGSSDATIRVAYRR